MEIYRVLRAKGCLVSLDPVLKEVADEEEKRLNELIEEAFQPAHGPEFKFFTTTELRGLYQRAGFSIETCQVHGFSFQRRGIDRIPMGPHWLQAYELLRFRQEESLINRFEQNYFRFRGKNGKLLATGKMSWTAIRAIKH